MKPRKRQIARRNALIVSAIAVVFAIPAAILPTIAEDDLAVAPAPGSEPVPSSGFSLDTLWTEVKGATSGLLDDIFAEPRAVEQDPRGADWNNVSFTAAEAEARLAPDGPDRLIVAPDGSAAGYDRDEWNHWVASDLGADCDVRDAILYRDAIAPSIESGCQIVATWRDPYTGAEIADQGGLDIDHMVPLAAAERSGASGWSDAQRETYANDPLVTLAVDLGENRAKGDRGPETWKPVNQGSWCSYSVRWVEVKATYGLTVNEAEAAALRDMLATCA